MKIPILTVVFNNNKKQFDISNRTWESFPENSAIFAVINRKLDDAIYPQYIKYFVNDRNNLGKAWNIGLKEIFKEYDYAVISNLDLKAPAEDQIEEMVEVLRQHPEYGVVSATPYTHGFGEAPIKHGDGSFSFFIISKETYNKVGDFDECYDPCYFEDDSYLERLWRAGFNPRRLAIYYYHIVQGTLKNDPETQAKYASFMNKNLQIFKDTYGKVPDHLPSDIVFK